MYYQHNVDTVALHNTIVL